MANEGWTTLIVNQKTVDDMDIFQTEMWDLVRNRASDNEVGQALGHISLGTAAAGFFFPGVAVGLGIVSFATGFISALTSSDVAVLDSVIGHGVRSLNRLQRDVRETTNRYDLYEIEFPYLDYRSGGKTIRFIQGDIRILRAHVRGGNGWVIF